MKWCSITLDLSANVASVSLRFQYAVLLQLMASATFVGVEELDVHVLRGHHDVSVDIFTVNSATSSGLSHALANAPRLRRLTLHMCGPRGLLLYSVVKTISKCERALESVTIDFDMVELEGRTEGWQGAVQRILSSGNAAMRRTRWRIRVRENESARSELRVN